jgi:hypothetical protein
MRGQCEAYLVSADDGSWYVTKFANHRYGPRALVNELLGSLLLEVLGLSTPQPALIHVTPDFVARNPNVRITTETGIGAPSTGVHYGSQYPGDPAEIAVHDLVPDRLLAQTYNLTDFLGMFVVDKWLAQTDSRQAVFFRGQIKRYRAAAPAHPLRKGLLALMIDNEGLFGGPAWNFCEAPMAGRYFRPLVYESMSADYHLQHWVDRIRTMPEQMVWDCAAQIPPDWYTGIKGELEMLLSAVLERRHHVERLVHRAVDYSPLLTPGRPLRVRQSAEAAA